MCAAEMPPITGRPFGVTAGLPLLPAGARGSLPAGLPLRRLLPRGVLPRGVLPRGVLPPNGAGAGPVGWSAAARFAESGAVPPGCCCLEEEEEEKEEAKGCVGVVRGMRRRGGSGWGHPLKRSHTHTHSFLSHLLGQQ
jgi:hypothetical protein